MVVFYFYSMKVHATNIAQAREIVWNGKSQVTGIYKFPVNEAVRLESEGVKGDVIGNKKVHGGTSKACYLFSSEHYDYWKPRYPDLDWHWGMFGENLTTEGLLDDSIQVGDIYKIGSALVQATIPREPCYKLGIKFGDQGIVANFIDHGYPGTYVRILEEGEVSAGDPITRVESASDSLSIRDFFVFLNCKEKNKEVLKALLGNPYVPEYKKEKLRRYTN